jgi:homoserine O-acetyltransferase
MSEPTFEGDFTFADSAPFELEGGGTLRPVTLRYALYGELNARRDNAILVCHALSGSARVADWWPAMLGEGCAFDPSVHCIIGINVVGSCYGSTGPSSINPDTGKVFGSDFPLVTVGDMVRAEKALLDHLGIERLLAVTGGSIGGMQALDWAVRFPESVAKCIAVGASPLPAMGLALNHLQRQAIRNDPKWQGGNYSVDDPPVDGLALARAIAVCSYKSAGLFSERYGRRPNRTGELPHRSFDERYDVAGYLDYQGQGFTRRFDANTYLRLSKAMDTFDLTDESLHRITAEVVLVGISSDWLFPAAEVEALANRLTAAGVDSHYLSLSSAHGHDGFLADAADLAALIKPFLEPDQAKVDQRTAGAVLASH